MKVEELDLLSMKMTNSMSFQRVEVQWDAGVCQTPVQCYSRLGKRPTSYMPVRHSWNRCETFACLATWRFPMEETACDCDRFCKALHVSLGIAMHHCLGGALTCNCGSILPRRKLFLRSETSSYLWPAKGG